MNCIRSSQDQGNQYSNVGRGGAHKASAQAEQLLAVDCYWKKENHLPSRAWPWGVAHVWVDGPTSVHEVGSVDIKTKEETWSWEVGCVGGGSGRSWRGQWRVYVIKTHCINLQNSQRINKISLKLSYNSGYFGSQYLEGRLQDHDLFINSSSRKSWSSVWGGEAARGPVIENKMCPKTVEGTKASLRSLLKVPWSSDSRPPEGVSSQWHHLWGLEFQYINAEWRCKHSNYNNSSKVIKERREEMEQKQSGGRQGRRGEGGRLWALSSYLSSLTVAAVQPGSLHDCWVDSTLPSDVA